MRHKAQVSTFGRKESARLALFRGLVTSLVEHGRITTTVAKAKELRRHIERAITMGRKNTLHAKRLLFSRYPSVDTVGYIMNDWGPAFVSRPGGYTRILKVGARKGDSAELAIIEFLDYQKVINARASGAEASKKGAAAKKAAKAAAPKKAKPAKEVKAKKPANKKAAKA